MTALHAELRIVGKLLPAFWAKHVGHLVLGLRQLDRTTSGPAADGNGVDGFSERMCRHDRSRATQIFLLVKTPKGVE